MIGLYLHVPYCTVRCSYCDFYLKTGRAGERSTFVEALASEIAAVGRKFPGQTADTVHLGGGTPSVLAPEAVSRILAAVRAAFELSPGAEIGLEANPEDLEPGRLSGYLEVGVNRLAIGIQSLDDRLLKLMGRPHDARRAIEAIDEARRSGIRSIGIDLILGLPGQDRRTSLEDVARLADRDVDHVSLYLLEVHDRTRLGREVARGRRTPMGDDEAAELYEEAADRLVERGFEHYEISNFARPGHRSRHNVKYWTDEEYLGFGPSAHSYVGGRRWENEADLDAYLACGGVGVRQIEDGPSPTRRAVEALVAGLRLAEGVDLACLRSRYGDEFTPPDVDCLEELERADLVRREAGRLRLTRRGRLVSNEVFERLLPATL